MFSPTPHQYRRIKVAKVKGQLRATALFSWSGKKMLHYENMSQAVLLKFYLPLFAISAAIFYIIAQQQPSFLQSINNLPIIGNLYTTSPLKYGLLLGLLVTIITLLIRKDVDLSDVFGQDSSAETYRYSADTYPPSTYYS